MANTTPHPVRGTQDMIGETADRFHAVVNGFKRVRDLYGFGRVEVPVIEPTAVFARSLGETTDVVAKEMYSFEDRSGDSVTLRPEFTAGILRAYLTNGWAQHAPLKLATHGPLFRYERPQKGRYRQFHQLDAEIIGAAEVAADVELLAMADQLLAELGIADGVTLQLNTLGDGESRDAWRDALAEHFRAHEGALGEDSVRRLATNPLRILDSKHPADRPVVEAAPPIDGFLTSAAADRFAELTAGLDAAGVAWTRNPRLVRGLDYYRHAAWEFVTDRLGAQGTVLAGGRYDGLAEALGGPPTPGVGWAAGMERLAMLMKEPSSRKPSIGVVTEADALAGLAMKIATACRSENFVTETFALGSPRKRFDKARKSGAKLIIVLDDYASGQGQIGSMRLKLQDSSADTFQRLPAVLTEHLGEWSAFDLDKSVFLGQEVRLFDGPPF